MADRRVIAALPAYNEEANLPALLAALKPYCDLIVIVDDGSTDATLSIIRAAALHQPIHVEIHAWNLGLGPTIRDALRAATLQCGEDDLIVTMDADNTHPPSLIASMVQGIEAGADVVIASRYRPGAKIHGLAVHRRLLSHVASCLFRVVFPTRGVRDYTCGYRVYRATVFRKALDHYGDRLVEAEGFSCMAEILLKLRALGCRFDEVPLELHYDRKGGASKMRLWRTISRTLWLIVRLRMKVHHGDK